MKNYEGHCKATRQVPSYGEWDGEPTAPRVFVNCSLPHSNKADFTSEFGIFHVSGIHKHELEFELVHSQMTQKPVLRGEVDVRV